MSSRPTRRSTSRTPSPLLPTLTSLGEVASPDPESNGEVEQDQLAFTIESPSRPQLQLFETMFNTGKPLSGYCEDDPLWSLLAAVASPCTNCLKSPSKCQVPPNCSAKKTCSLGKILWFLELHGTPAHRATWGIPLNVWHQYDAALHDRTSSTSTLLELNMLDEQDEVDANQKELQEFLILQQDEASIAAKRKRAHSPLPVVGPSSKKVQSEAPKKRSRRKSPVMEVASEPPCRIRLVVPPVRSSVMAAPTPVPLHALPSPMEVRLLESELAKSQRENSSLMTALCDTSQALEARQWEVEQLRTSSREFVQHQVEYRRIIDQFNTLDRALSGPPGQSLPERFQKVEEEL
ncbi:hypothetical protein EV359DRAFT_68973 [Lentinula novae-zelandiae]|nr:hypothetical protein EV359DRAFT_68973 [Lentinula novae-zelandiae]